jgi:hypothetical protein
MKRFLPWPDESLAALRTLLKNDPKLNAQVDAAARSFLVPPKIPKECFDSQERALSELNNKACGMKTDAQGNCAPEKYYLEMVKSTGTALSVGGLREFLGGVVPVRFKNKTGTRYDETLEPDTVLLPAKEDCLWASEARLNHFLIQLGRALAKSGGRGKPLWIPDWREVKEVNHLIVLGWCDRILVAGEHWPPLCCLTYGALAKFLTLCKPSRWNIDKVTRLPSNPRTLEAEIRRELGLVSIPKGKIKQVESRFGQFRFR